MITPATSTKILEPFSFVEGLAALARSTARCQVACLLYRALTVTHTTYVTFDV